MAFVVYNDVTTDKRHSKWRVNIKKTSRVLMQESNRPTESSRPARRWQDMARPVAKVRGSVPCFG